MFSALNDCSRAMTLLEHLDSPSILQSQFKSEMYTALKLKVIFSKIINLEISQTFFFSCSILYVKKLRLIFAFVFIPTCGSRAKTSKTKVKKAVRLCSISPL